MPHDGYTRGVLYGPYERVAPARYDEVDVSVLREQRCDLSARLDGLHECVRELSAR
jgi:hypothetical protein